MAIHNSLRHSSAAGNGVSGALPASAARARAGRALVALVLALAALGTLMLAWPGHTGASPARLGAHQAGHPAPASVTAVSSAVVSRPWIL